MEPNPGTSNGPDRIHNAVGDYGFVGCPWGGGHAAAAKTRHFTWWAARNYSPPASLEGRHESNKPGLRLVLVKVCVGPVITSRYKWSQLFPSGGIFPQLEKLFFTGIESIIAFFCSWWIGGEEGGGGSSFSLFQMLPSEIQNTLFSQICF